MSLLVHNILPSEGQTVIEKQMHIPMHLQKITIPRKCNFQTSILVVFSNFWFCSNSFHGNSSFLVRSASAAELVEGKICINSLLENDMVSSKLPNKTGWTAQATHLAAAHCSSGERNSRRGSAQEAGAGYVVVEGIKHRGYNSGISSRAHGTMFFWRWFSVFSSNPHQQ